MPIVDIGGQTKPIDKVVALAAGLGTRMRRADESAGLSDAQRQVADSGVKALIPMDTTSGRRPFLDYVLHELAEAGFKHVCLVVASDHRALRDCYSASAGFHARRLSISFALQERPRGTANALASAEDFAGGEQFLMINGDNLYPASACAALRRIDGPGTALFERGGLLRGGNIPADRLANFAVGIIAPDGTLQQVIEKPDEATLASMAMGSGSASGSSELYLSMNCWRFSPVIFEACRRIKPSVRGEYEVPSAVQYAMDHLGERFAVVRSREPVLDLSSRADVAPVAALLAGREVSL
jgi:dTDP-glucose pyrophosphorylase